MENDDDDLERAIALSLREHSHQSRSDQPHHPAQPAYIISDSESDNEGDADLKAAIALSLRPAPSEEKGRNGAGKVIDLVSDSGEDDDLDAPVHSRVTQRKPTSKSESETVVREPRNSNVEEPAVGDGSSSSRPAGDDVQQETSQGTMFQISQLNRKQMENDRLARLANMKPQVLAVPGDSRKRKAEDDTLLEEEQIRQVKHRSSNIASFSSLATISPNHDHVQTLGEGNLLHGNRSPTTTPDTSKVVSHGTASHSAVAGRSDAGGLQYPDGVIKKTWCRGFLRTENDIKLEEVLQKDDLQFAVLSAFQIDADWIISKLNPATKVVWILQAKTEDEKKNWRSDAPKHFKFCFPSSNGNVNCMHSKLQLLAHTEHLRIVVPSANLVPYDWGETGVMENSCFLIDLPRLSAGKRINRDDLTSFGTELIYFLEAMGLEQNIVDSVLKFDFSRTKGFEFIHTIGGSHSGESWKRTGYCGLGSAVKRLGLETDGPISVDFVASSIGSLNSAFIKSIYLAGKGDDGLTEYEWRTQSKTKKRPFNSPAEEQAAQGIQDNFRIYFPAHETVAKSRGGVNSGGTICFQARWFDNETFPKELMRDCKSQREGMLMHNKMMFVRHHDEPRKSWVYVGSANLSESAWGRLVKDKVAKEPKLNCRNWECGVIVPAKILTQQSVGLKGPPTMTIFEGYVPMEVPGAQYAARRPWFYSNE